MTTPTPETDAIEKKIFAIIKGLADADDIPAILHAISLEMDDARKLERERDEAKETIKLCNERIREEEARADGIGNRIAKERAEAHCKRISAERDQLIQKADELDEIRKAVLDKTGYATVTKTEVVAAMEKADALDWVQENHFTIMACHQPKTFMCVSMGKPSGVNTSLLSAINQARNKQ